MTHLFRAAIFAVVACALAPSTARAQQPAAATAWSEFEVPGTARGFARAAGVSDDTPADQLFLQWFRVVTVPDANGVFRATRLHAYALSLAEFTTAQKAFGPSLSMDDIRQRRKAAEPLVEQLGMDIKGNNRSLRVVRNTDREAEANRTVLAAAGLNLDRAEEVLNGGGHLDLMLPSFKALLPMDLAWWQQHVFRVKVGPDTLWRALLADDNALGLYYGLASAPSATRAYIASQPELIKFAYGDRPGTFAVHIGHVRMDGGVIAVPGGPAAKAVWEQLIDERADAPSRFIRKLLTKDDGKFAVFYSTLDTFDGPHLRFALGFGTPSFRPGRFDVARSVYDEWFHIEDKFVATEERPFRKPALDPALLLGQVTLDRTDGLLGPAWPALWEQVFDGLDLPERPRVAISARLEADGLSRLVFRPQRVLDDYSSLERLQTFVFGQRVFLETAPADAGDLLIALRGFQRFPALHLALERAGVRAPNVHAAAARRAAALSQIDHADMAYDTLSQLQGSLVLVEAAVRVGSLAPDAATTLVSQLVGIETDRDGSYGGRIVQWLDRSLLPALAGSSTPLEPSSIDDALITALAGARTPSTHRFDFEDQRYSVVPSRALLQRLRILRKAQETNALGPIVAIARSADTLRSATRDALIAELRQYVAEWPRAVAEPRHPAKLGDVRRLTVKETVTWLDREAAKLARSKNAKVDVRAFDDAVQQLTALLAADALRALAYALAVGDADSSLFSAGDVSFNHDFGLVAASAQDRERAAWSLPDAQEGHTIRGALLGLDLALADTAMTSLELSAQPEVSTWPMADQTDFLKQVVLFNPFDPRLEALPRIGEALARARERLRAATSTAAVAALLDDARIPPLRRALIERAAAASPATPVTAWLSLTELLRLGIDEDSRASADALGTTAVMLRGCLCLAQPPAINWELFEGRPETVTWLSAGTADLLLRLAEALATRHVPGAVIAAILPTAARVVLDHAHPNHWGDWESLSKYASTISERQIDDLLSAATAQRKDLLAVELDDRN